MLLAKRSLNNWLNHNIFVVDFAVEILQTFVLLVCFVVPRCCMLNQQEHLFYLYFVEILMLMCRRIWFHYSFPEYNWFKSIDSMEIIEIQTKYGNSITFSKRNSMNSSVLACIYERSSVCERYFFAFGCRSVCERWVCCCYCCTIFFISFLSLFLNFLFVLSCAFRSGLHCVERACKLELKDFIPVCTTCFSVFFFIVFSQTKRHVLVFTHIPYTRFASSLYDSTVCLLFVNVLSYFLCVANEYMQKNKQNQQQQQQQHGTQLTGANASENL